MDLRLLSSHFSSAVDAQQVLKSTFNSISVIIDSYQSVLEHTLLKVDFSIDTGIYMLPVNLDVKNSRMQQ